MKQGRLGYNSSNDKYGLLASDLWIDTGFHCGEGLEVLVDDKWVRTRMEQGIRNTVDYVLSHPECQVEDPEFDAWCDKLIAVLEKAKEEMKMYEQQK